MQGEGRGPHFKERVAILEVAEALRPRRYLGEALLERCLARGAGAYGKSVGGAPTGHPASCGRLQGVAVTVGGRP